MVFPFSQKELAQNLDDLGDIDAFGTADVARHAGSAGPDGFGFEQLIFKPELGVSDDLIGEDVHVGDGRTSGRALAALVADKKVLAAEFLYFFNEGILAIFAGDVDSHV